MDAFVAYQEQNHAVAVEFTDCHVIITTRDGRIVYVPLDWFSWLKNASPEVREKYEIWGTSINWTELDEGFSMQTVLLGKPTNTTE